MHSLLFLAAAFGADPAPPAMPASEHWSFQPVAARKPPAVKDAAWARNDIDRFILSKLEAERLPPAKPADARTLIRRATFDLTGLPPTPAEIDRFLKESAASPQAAYEALIDRLLASSAYGERWGRHWLDVVRYADSRDARGMGGDTDIAEAWRYRDWVIAALNKDYPYDRFVVDQIAGDRIPAEQRGAINADGLIATGLLTIGEWGTGDSDKEKMVSDIVDDQINIVTRSFLGLTVGCARCHDHKFDPITQQDYYGLAGIFFSTKIVPAPGAKTAGTPLLRTPLLSAAQIARRADHPKLVAQAEAKLKAALEKHTARLREELLGQSSRYIRAAWEFRNRAGTEPTVGAFAERRDLLPFVLQAWIDELYPPVYTTLATPIRDVAGKPGLHGWRGKPDNPSAVINTTNAEVAFVTIKAPPRSINVHPGPKSAVAVAWASPMSGTVRISGKVSDADGVCGDGIGWRIDHRRAAGPVELASGEYANGGTQSFDESKAARRLNEVEVTPGDRIELLILPKKEYSCDTTTIQLEIAEVGGTRNWSLTGDVVADPLAGNPHADRHGNAAVWYFFDAGASQSLPDAPLATLRRALATATDGLVAATAARAFRDTSTRLDAFIGAVLARPEAERVLPEPGRSELMRLRQELDDLRQNPPPAAPMALAAQEGGVPGGMFPGIQDVPIHIRGSYTRLGEKVPRRFPTVLAGANQPPIASGSGRLELAKWIADAKNPLTARVVVNRVWAWHFGEGIVRTTSNFGKLGEPPTHSELLDWLADRFIKDGWSLKKLHRVIMLSATYRQSSVGADEALKRDPDNRFFARMNVQRLEAEAVRDALLAVAGNLERTPGGMSFTDLKTPRRTVYLRAIRSDKSGYQALFDAPDPETPTEKRITSTVAPQALFLLNHPFAVEQAKLLGKRLKELPAKSDAERVGYAYTLLYGREPKPDELRVGLAFLSGSSWEGYAQVLLCANEFIYVD